MSELLKGLNEQQRKIVESTEGYKLVLAGAGSGKTRVLTYSIAYLIEQELAKPSNILAVTFTNKAASEMKDRISLLVNTGSNKNWWIGTFHGVCVRILVKHGHEIGIPPYFVIADEKEQKSILNSIIPENSMIDKDVAMNLLGEAKNNLKTPGDYLLAETEEERYFGGIYEKYQEKLERMNALDFDDLIMKTVHLLRVCDNVREQIQNQFKYVLVDESQDLNTSQYELALLFSGKCNNLSLIGDSDQGIYSWRGANIDIINNFSKIEGVKIMPLVQNYRCTQTIIESANNMIKFNKNRLDKTLFTDNEEGEKIVLYTADNEYQEAGFVASVVDYYSNRLYEYNYRDFAVLYRTNGQARVVEEQLNKHFIPYTIVNGTSFYERKEVKDTLAYLRLLINDHDLLAFERVANEPKRGVGATSLKRLSDYIFENGYSVYEGLDNIDAIPKLQKKSKAALVKLKNILIKYRAEVDESDPDRMIKEMMTELGYFDMLDQTDEKERVANIYELANSAGYAKSESEQSLPDFIRELSLVSDSDGIENDNTVKLMTVHTAKGLEYPVVFVIGLEENIFPHYLSLHSQDKDQMEEERRSFYVAMTRAEKRLFLTSAEKRRYFGKEISNDPSRFLTEIPKAFLKDA